MRQAVVILNEHSLPPFIQRGHRLWPRFDYPDGKDLKGNKAENPVETEKAYDSPAPHSVITIEPSGCESFITVVTTLN